MDILMTIAIIVGGIQAVSTAVGFVTFVNFFNEDMQAHANALKERAEDDDDYRYLSYKNPEHYLEKASSASMMAKVSLAGFILSPLAILVIPAVGIFFAMLGIKAGVQKALPALKFEHP